MHRPPYVNYASPASTTNRPMFFRPLSAVDSAPAQAVVGAWTHWYWPRSSWWTRRGPAATPQQPRYPSIPIRPPSSDPFSWREWRRLGLFPSTDPPRAFHQSSGLMERSDKEPPLKKRRKIEDKDAHGSPNHPAPKPSREQIPAWLQNVTGVPITPGKFPPSNEKTRSKKELQRLWEDVSGSSEPQVTTNTRGRHFDFSVMSYNILSQELLLSNSYLYRHCNPQILEWPHRFPRIIKELEQYSADIMCLQEVQEDHYEKQIKPCLESQGYHCEYKQRTGRKPDGCAVVFKRERFSLVSRHPVEYFRRGIPLLDRDNVGLVLLLRPTEASYSAHSICVANTHLLYNPRRGDIKLTQLAMLLAEINRITRLDAADVDADSPCPVVLCGDFNSVPSSPLYSFIKESRLEYAGMPVGKVSGQEEGSRGQRVLTVPIWPSSLGISQQCRYQSQDKATSTEPDKEKIKKPPKAAINSLNKPSIEHGLKLTSVYSHYLRESGKPEITTCHSRTAITVDYIFYSAAQKDQSSQTECSVAGLQLLARLALVGETELEEVNGLPNQHNSSDHLPLLAQFRLHS